jgi:hypothetical protein
LPTYSYLDLEEGVPAAPIFPIIITPPDWADSVKQHQIDGFLDTGSDCTLVPLEVLSMLDLKILNQSVTIAGVGGAQFQGLPCFLNIVVGDQSIAVRNQIQNWFVAAQGFEADLIRQLI